MQWLTQDCDWICYPCGRSLYNFPSATQLYFISFSFYLNYGSLKLTMDKYPLLLLFLFSYGISLIPVFIYPIGNWTLLRSPIVVLTRWLNAFVHCCFCVIPRAHSFVVFIFSPSNQMYWSTLHLRRVLLDKLTTDVRLVAFTSRHVYTDRKT